MKRKHQKKVIKASIEFLKQRNIDTIEIVEEPDERIRNEEAVDLLCKSGQNYIVFEHTLIESYPFQIEEEKRLFGCIGQLEYELSGVLPKPGYYSLIIDPNGKRVKIRDCKKVVDIIKEWILSIAPELVFQSPENAPAHYQELNNDLVPFGVKLERHAGDNILDGSLLLARKSPEDLDERRAERISTAIEEKCPKLDRAKNHNDLSALVLESNNIGLDNFHDISASIASIIRTKDEYVPDYIYLVETDSDPWYVTLVKDPSRMFPTINNEYITVRPHDV